MARTIGTAAYGLRCGMLKQGDPLEDIVVDTVLNSGLEIKDKDIVAITESVVARCAGLYVTIDEVAEDIRKKMGEPKNITIFYPIYSRNRFSMILKAIARAAKEEVVICVENRDYVGNVLGPHPFTGLIYSDLYKKIVEAEGKHCKIINTDENGFLSALADSNYKIYCSSTHEFDKEYQYKALCDISMQDICSDKCEYGLYGTNLANQETLKLFPTKEIGQPFVDNIQRRIYEKTGKKVECLIYGDGAFRDPDSGIWELADYCVSPAYTKGLIGKPSEIKIKNFLDEKYKDLSNEDLDNAIKEEIKNKQSDLVANQKSQGTTPRNYTNLIGSLCDLVSGSGDKATCIVYIQGYFDNYLSE